MTDRRDTAPESALEAEEIERLKEAGYLLFCQGKLGDAALVFADVALRAPAEPYPHEALGAIYLSAGRPLEAVLAYTQAIHLLPESAKLYARRGEALARLGELEVARDDWAMALRLGLERGDPRGRFVRAALAAHARRE